MIIDFRMEVQKMSKSKNQAFLNAVDSMVMAMGRVCETWYALEFDAFDQTGKKFPFSKEFSELLSDVMEWRDELHENIAD